jgi:hypothetical protein
MTTAEALRGALSNKDVFEGLISRFMWFRSEDDNPPLDPTKECQVKIDATLVDMVMDYADTESFYAMRKEVIVPVHVRLALEAIAKKWDIRNRYCSETEKAIYNRSYENCRRVLFAVSHQDTLTIADLNWAIDLVEATDASCLGMISELNHGHEATAYYDMYDKIHALIMAKGGDTDFATKSEVTRVLAKTSRYARIAGIKDLMDSNHLLAAHFRGANGLCFFLKKPTHLVDTGRFARSDFGDVPVFEKKVVA